MLSSHEGIELRMFLQRTQDGLCDDAEHRHPDTLEPPAGPKTLDQCRRLAHVDGQEDARLWRFGDAAHHGFRHPLLNAADRGTRPFGRLALGVAGRCRVRAPGGTGSEIGRQVVARDDPSGPVANHIGQVDAFLFAP